jgi:hypothetical protein
VRGLHYLMLFVVLIGSIVCLIFEFGIFVTAALWNVAWITAYLERETS